MAPFRRQSVPVPTVDRTMGDPGAARLLADVERRDWRAVHEFLRGVEDPGALDFYVGLISRSKGVQAWAGEWAEAEPRSHLPMLVRGAHAIDWAWMARGAKWASKTSRAQFQIFLRRLRFAHDYLTEAAARNPHDPTAWSELIVCGVGMGLGVEEAQRRFREAVARSRWHLGAHAGLFMQLCRKWGGSDELMHGFAVDTAASAPPETGLAVLVADAHIERWLYLGREGGKSQEHLLRPDTRAELHAAADRSVRHPAYRGRLGWQSDHNRLAMPFWLADEFDAAAEMFDVLGDQVTTSPWMYFGGEPGEHFVRARAECYRRRTAPALPR
ncbi:hypothetical protein [Cryptosporangium aurantiacum]|uniref:DUF4034 domain-containing protein n=1 Tax=Cryptosporangium aurantiacum TaxID=134849 RepID=A0A1M7RAY3_9ACTN|nr:hypothetical protein [Cryptosporangium aurantiacum]SHN43228.1 hypothetical protein SAMN05443668_10983 [Cryptosporangium aurantiacum]